MLEKAFNSDLKVGGIAIDIALYHHERYDGKGYPEGLKGEEIPLPARIVALVDVFDALMNKRVYKDAWGVDDVLSYIEENAGTQFDPRLVKLFLVNINCFTNVLSEYGSDDYTNGFCKFAST